MGKQAEETPKGKQIWGCTQGHQMRPPDLRSPRGGEGDATLDAHILINISGAFNVTPAFLHAPSHTPCQLRLFIQVTTCLAHTKHE